MIPRCARDENYIALDQSAKLWSYAVWFKVTFYKKNVHRWFSSHNTYQIKFFKLGYLLENFGPALCGIAWISQWISSRIKTHIRVLIWGQGVIYWRKNPGSKISCHCIVSWQIKAGSVCLFCEQIQGSRSVSLWNITDTFVNDSYNSFHIMYLRETFIRSYRQYHEKVATWEYGAISGVHTRTKWRRGFSLSKIVFDQL
jgi:hypothetical protein